MKTTIIFDSEVGCNVFLRGVDAFTGEKFTVLIKQDSSEKYARELSDILDVDFEFAGYLHDA